MKNALEQLASERFGNTYCLATFVTADMSFAADDCSWIVCPLDVLIVDDAHLMRQKVALLKSAASMLPFIYPKSVSKIEPERLPCLPPGSDKIERVAFCSTLRCIVLSIRAGLRPNGRILKPIAARSFIH